MHPAPVRRHDAAPLDLPHWAIGEPEPDDTLDLTVYERVITPAEAERIRNASARFVTFVVCAAGLLLFWMVGGLLIAHRAGRI